MNGIEDQEIKVSVQDGDKSDAHEPGNRSLENKPEVDHRIEVPCGLLNLY